MDTIKTLYNEDKTRRVRIEYDMDGSSCDPSEYNELVEIVTPDLRRWNVRTEGARFQAEHDALYDRGLGGAFARYLRIFHDVEAAPVYMYEHSGVALSTGSFIGRAQHAEWDSGMIGWAYINPAAETWEGMEPEKIIAGTVETLGQWMNGEVYGWISEELHHYKRMEVDAEGNFLLGDFTDAPEEWQEVDSCWGYIGYENVESAAREELGE